MTEHGSGPTKPVPDHVAEETVFSEKVADLVGRVHTLEGTVSWLRGGAAVIGLVFTLITGLGAWRLYESWNAGIAQREFTNVMTDALEGRVAGVVNSITVVEDPPEQKAAVNDLVNTRRRLVDAGVTSERLTRLGDLISAMYLLVIEKQTVKATQSLEVLIGTSTDDRFVNSRALAIKGMIDISYNRQRPSAAVESDLQRAIEIDGTVALAFNGLGIISANESQQAIYRGDRERALDLMRLSAFRFRMAAQLDPSAIGTYKLLNNLVWGALVLFQGSMDDHLRREDAWKFLEVDSDEEFFRKCAVMIDHYKSLAPTLPVALETESQLLSVHAANELKQGDSTKSHKLIDSAVESYVEAVERGLFLRVVSVEQALEQFQSDPLLAEVKRSSKRSEIEKAIKSYYATKPSPS